MVKFKINVESVLACTSRLLPLIGSKSVLPILDNFKLQGTKEKLYLTSSNGESWLTMCCPIESDNDFKICVGAKQLSTTLSGLNGRDVVVSIDDTRNLLVGNYGKGTFKIPYVDTNEYPQNNDLGEGMTEIVFDSSRLSSAIQHTSFAVGTDELRPIMGGIHFDLAQDGMIVVASDGHKLVCYKDATIKNDGELKGFTLPAKTANIILPIIDKSQEQVKFVFNSSYAKISNERFMLVTRLQDGRYPNYNAVIPKGYTRTITINRTELIESLKRIMPLGNNTSKLVAFDFERQDISCEDLDYSTSANETIEYEDNEKGTPLRIGFNVTIMLQVLSIMSCENIVIWLKEPTNAALIEPKETNSDIEYKAVIMPLILN